MGASSFVLDVLENGFDIYKLSTGDLDSLVGQEHGATVVAEPAEAHWLRAEVERQVMEGKAELHAESDAHKFCLIKAFVVPKPRKKDAYRDVWDMRPVNIYLKKKKFKLER